MLRPGSGSTASSPSHFASMPLARRSSGLRRFLALTVVIIVTLVWSLSRAVVVDKKEKAGGDRTVIFAKSVDAQGMQRPPVPKKKSKQHVPEGPPVALGDKEQRLQTQEWELNYLRNTYDRQKRILDETHDEMIHAMSDLRSALRTIGSPPPAPGATASNLPCHCLEQSAMAPENVWCDNRRPRISGAHVCVLRNVCFGGGERLLFLSPKPSATEREIIRVGIAGTDQSGSIVHPPPPGEAARTGGDGIYEKVLATPIQNATVALYASKFSNHITHVLEGAGGLHFSVHRNEPRVADCAREDLTCFPPIAAFNFMGSSSAGEWHENVLRIAMKDIGKQVKIRFHDNIPNEPFQCFEKAVVPGFYYSVFPDTEDTSSFQQAAVAYLEQNAKIGNGKDKHSKTSWHASPQRLGRILMSKRTSKRAVRDWDVLMAFVRSVAANFTTEHGAAIEVSEIEYGRTGFDHQATTTADADILMGLHGADLTNMLFLRRGSVLLELNPLFFFENRFYELANNLGLHYMVWTCTTAACAFGGGDGRRFRSVVERFGYDFKQGVFHTQTGVAVRWPFDRYLGYSCPVCDGLGLPIMDFRDTDVLVGHSLDEIRIVLLRAFANLRWKQRAA